MGQFASHNLLFIEVELHACKRLRRDVDNNGSATAAENDSTVDQVQLELPRAGIEVADNLRQSLEALVRIFSEKDVERVYLDAVQVWLEACACLSFTRQSKQFLSV